MSGLTTISNKNTNDSIDFDFFESEDYLTKVNGKHRQSDSSKIITKAVIETEPDLLLDFPDNATIGKHSEQHFNGLTEERLSAQYRKSNCLSSPSSSLERTLLGLDDAARDALMNCLAYNDNERFDNRASSSLYSFDLRESSDNSLTDSTVTTVTSDFTSISPLSSSSLSSSSSNSVLDDHYENSAVECKSEGERTTDFITLNEDLKQEQSSTNDEALEEFKETDDPESLKSSTSEPESSDQKLGSDDENINSPEGYESDFESYNEAKYLQKTHESGETAGKNDNQIVSLSDKESHFSTQDEIEDISVTQSRSSSVKTSYKKRKNCNLTFSREELIRIERDNLILLKKIMVHSKHKPVSVNQQPFCHKKTSTAINRAKLQKKIEQDNYILYSKISAMSRLKKIF